MRLEPERIYLIVPRSPRCGHLMLPGGPSTQSDEDLSVMTIGSDRRCRRPKRSTSPRDEARSPHLDARKKIKQKHRTKFRVQFLPLAGAALTVIHNRD